MKSYAKWSEQESQTAFRLKDGGMSVQDIALTLRRSQNAVSSRLQIRKRIFDAMVDLAVMPVAQVTISKAEVVDFYAAGWRLVGFDNHSCTMEWPHADEPWRPIAMREAA